MHELIANEARKSRVGYQLITMRASGIIVLLYTPYLVVFLCFLELLFLEERQFLPRSASRTSPPS